MEKEITENSSCCNNSSCGCHVDAYATSRECPCCGKHLRLIGRAQLLEFRLTCGSCGYAGPLLSRDELGELI
jgi:predicted RNA-binding Zn-ribbon protein involved in translation (DUF1610 family)